jgi:hypothetical protein
MREFFMTPSAMEGRRIYNKIQSNLAAAKAAILAAQQRGEAPGGPSAGQRGIPDWLKEEMERKGLRPDRVFNDIDLGNPSVVAAIKSDPTLNEKQKAELLRTGSLPEWITKAAYRGTGRVETGANHPEILSRLGIKGFDSAESRNTPEFGFQTSRRPFVTREEAGLIAKASGQALKDFEPGEPVHSDEVRAPGTDKPISEDERARRQGEIADKITESRAYKAHDEYLRRLAEKRGEQSGPAATERGRKRVGEVGYPEGITVADARTIGFLKTFELHQYLNKITEELDKSWPDWRINFVKREVKKQSPRVQTLIEHLLLTNHELDKRERTTEEGAPEDIGPGVGPSAGSREENRYGAPPFMSEGLYGGPPKIVDEQEGRPEDIGPGVGPQATSREMREEGEPVHSDEVAQPGTDRPIGEGPAAGGIGPMASAREMEPSPGSRQSVDSYGLREDNRRIVRALLDGTKPMALVDPGLEQTKEFKDAVAEGKIVVRESPHPDVLYNRTIAALPENIDAASERFAEHRNMADLGVLLGFKPHEIDEFYQLFYHPWQKDIEDKAFLIRQQIRKEGMTPAVEEKIRRLREREYAVVRARGQMELPMAGERGREQTPKALMDITGARKPKPPESLEERDALYAKIEKFGVQVNGQKLNPDSVAAQVAEDILLYGYAAALRMAKNPAAMEDFPDPESHQLYLNQIKSLKGADIRVGSEFPPPEWKSEVQLRLPLAGDRERELGEFVEEVTPVAFHPRIEPRPEFRPERVLPLGRGPEAGRREGESDEEYRRRLAADLEAMQKRFLKKPKQKLAEEKEKLAGQAGLFGAPAGAPGGGGAPAPVPLEERGAPPGLPQRPDVEAIRKGMQDIFDGRPPLTDPETKLPEEYESSFRSAYKWVQEVNPNIDKQHAMQLWADTVIRNIEGATGEQLAALIDRFKVGNRVYPFQKIGGKTIYNKLAISNETEIPPAFSDIPKEMRDVIISAIQRSQNMSREEAIEYLKGRRTRALSQRRLRDKALAAIFYDRVIKELEKPDVPVDRTDIKVDDLGWKNPNTKEGVWRTIRPDERNIEKLRQIMGDEAIRFSFDPSNHTRRTMVLLNKRSGEVAWVSGYNVTGDVNVMEPSGGRGPTGYPNVKLSGLLGEWDPILSGLLAEPIKDFRKTYRDIDAFNRDIGKDAADYEQTSVIEELGFPAGDFDRGDIPEWMAMAYEEGPRMLDVETETGTSEVPYDLVQQMQQGFGGRPPMEEETTYRPGTMVTEGEGGGYVGPYASQFKTKPGQLLKNPPLQAHEVMALVDWLHDPAAWSHMEVKPGGVTTEPDMQRAIEKLIDMARTGHMVPQPTGLVRASASRTLFVRQPPKFARGLAPKELSAVIAMHKAMAEQFRRDKNEYPALLREATESMRGMTPQEREDWLNVFRQQMEPTPERSGELALRRLYGLIKDYEASKAAETIASVLAEFSRPTPRPKGAELARILSTVSPPSITGPVFQEPPDITLPGPHEQGPRLATTGVEHFIPPEKPTEPYFETRGLTGPTTPGKVGGEAFKPERLKSGVPKPFPFEARQQVKEASIERLRRKPFIGPRLPGEGPAAGPREAADNNRRRFEDIAEPIKRFTTVPISRANTFYDLNAAADGADRLVEWYANGSSLDIRIASVAGPQDIGTLRKLWHALYRGPGSVLYSPEAMKVRRGIIAAIAGKQAANSREWQRVMEGWKQAKTEMAQQWAMELRQWNEMDPATRPATPPLSPIREELKPHYKRPDWFTPEDLDQSFVDVEEGIRNAQKALTSEFPRQRMRAKRWLKAAKELRDILDWTKANHENPELRRATEMFEAVEKQHLENMNNHGLYVTGRDYYVPGRFEGELWHDNALMVFQQRILGTRFRLPKTYDNYFKAIKDQPFVPVNLDAADLAQHSLAAGGRIMAREGWMNGLKKVLDPADGKPIAIEPEWGLTRPPKMTVPSFEAWFKELMKQLKDHEFVPREILNQFLKEAGITQMPWTYKVPEGHQDYDLAYPTRRSKPMAVKLSYLDAVENVMAESAIRKIPGLREALTVSQMMKHGLILILDTFHPGRLAQYALALGAGRGGLRSVFGRGGITALQYEPESMPEAVRIGAISKKSMDWALEEIPIHDGDQIRRMTRQQILRMLSTRGLNATQTADTLYRDAIQRIPFIGKTWSKLLSAPNRWIFDQITPGIIAENGVRKFIQSNQKNRHLSMDEQIREVVRDLNVYYGNIGRNGIFKNPTVRDISQLFLLAPLWQEGLIGKELRVYSRLIGASYALGRRGLGPRAYYGSLTSGLFYGLGAYFLLTQMINYLSRGHSTFENPEPGHKWDAWLPLGKEGLWLSPMSVFGEVTHDIWRLAETKDPFWQAIIQFGRNKLGPIGRFSIVMGEGRTPQGEGITSTGSVLSRAAQELAPLPISIGTPLKAIGQAVSPEMMSHLPGQMGQPLRPGQLGQRTLGAVGIKAQLPSRTELTVQRLARDFVKQHKLRSQPMEFSPTDEPSFSKLRGALRNQDFVGARRLLNQLRETHTDDQIVRSMELASRRPFTGSQNNEEQFLYSLTPPLMEMYWKANMDRAHEYQAFLEWFFKEPQQ